ncbi:MAG: hypothetical protein U0796_05290 [Gemmatales bacterium]
MSTAPEIQSSPPPPSFLERLLSPQGIQALLGTGGALFVGGLITWLATLGVFDHPLVLAACLGGVNLALLFAGFALVLRSRYQLAGLALTLLACLVMPLHLWFYHAQHLLTFDNHLWAAALVISLLYALTARVLQNLWFVPIFLGGIAMTTLLILADLGQFWQVTAPAIALVGMGLVAIHVERLFTQDAASPFRRERFGLAFFWSGHALLGLGLLMVLVAQLAGGPLYAHYTKSIYDQWSFTRTELVTTQSGKGLALFLVLVGVYAHLYSDMVVRRKGYCLQIAALLLVWVEFIVIDLLNISLSIESLLGLLAGTGLLIQLLHRLVGHRLPGQMPVLPFLASLLSIGATIVGLFCYFTENVHYVSSELSLHTIQSLPTLLLSMAVAAVALAGGSFTSTDRKAKLYHSGFGLAVLLVGTLAIGCYAVANWYVQCALVLGMVCVAVVVSWQLRQLREIGQFAHLFAAFWLLVGMPKLLALGSSDIWLIVGVLSLALLFYALCTVLLKQRGAFALALLSLVLIVLHVFAWLQLVLAYKMAAGAVLGASLLVAGKATARSASLAASARVLTKMGSVIFFVSTLATILLGVQTLVAYTSHAVIWPVFFSLLLEGILAAVFYLMNKKDVSANLFFATAVTNASLAVVLLTTMLELPMWRKLEVASVGLGLFMTVLGFRAWLQEVQERHQQPSVSPMFLLGSLLVGVPMVLVVMGYRSSGQFMVLDEASMFIVGLVMLGLGCLCQLRIPAMAGAALTLLYLAGLLLFVPWGQLGTAALVLAGGGAGLFLIGLGLSIFRDRLLALPQQVKQRQGIFQVLGWR